MGPAGPEGDAEVIVLSGLLVQASKVKGETMLSGVNS